MVAQGIVIKGTLIKDTEWCLRDPSAWFEPGDYSVRPRAPLIDLLVGHWTGGEAGAARFDDDGPWVYRVFRGRTRNGRKLKVSVHFVVGACSPNDEYAQVWQLADPGLVACVHTGSGAFNARSIGVEVVNQGLPPALTARPRPELTVKLVGRNVDVLAFYPGQLRSWIRLANTLAQAGLPGKISIPRMVPLDDDLQLLSRRFTEAEERRWKGAAEHIHQSDTSKLDGGIQLIRALHQSGWIGSAASGMPAGAGLPVAVAPDDSPIDPERCPHCKRHLTI